MSTTVDVKVFMLAETLEVKRLVIDQELGPLNTNCAYAHWKHVVIDSRVRISVDQRDLQLVEIAVTWLPQMHIGHT